MKRGLLANGESLDEAICNLTKKIYEAHSKEEKLEILIGDGKKKKKQDGFQLAMASAVLTILYPNDFTVYDFRVRGQLRSPKNSERKYPDITYTENRIQRYFGEYVPSVLERGREISQNHKLSLRDCDRLLWAKSWHEGLMKFLDG